MSEGIKKLLDDKIIEMDFKELDRPLHKYTDINDIRDQEKNWEFFKRDLEEQTLKHSFYDKQKYY